MTSDGDTFHRRESTSLQSTFRARPLAVAVLLGIFGGILTLTFLFPRDNPYPWNYVSALLGWSYLAAWSVSFYPQIFLLKQRRSTAGLSYDFVWLNAVGFFCYSVYNLCLFANDGVIQSYKERNDGNIPLVAFNDVAFAVHAAGITLVTLMQMYACGYESVGALSRIGKAFIAGTTCAAVLYCLAVVLNGDGAWKKDKSFMDHNLFTWLSVIYFLSFVKLTISTVKYMPQAYLNFARKSTVGWSIANVVLDFSGGLLSVAQLMVDGFHGPKPNNWAGIVGNPVKFGLGFVSMFFDIIFMIQHYILYRHAAIQNSVVHDSSGNTSSSSSVRVGLDESETEPLRRTGYELDDADADDGHNSGTEGDLESDFTSPMLRGRRSTGTGRDESSIASARGGVGAEGALSQRVVSVDGVDVGGDGCSDGDYSGIGTTLADN
jgi:cystinosin